MKDFEQYLETVKGMTMTMQDAMAARRNRIAKSEDWLEEQDEDESEGSEKETKSEHSKHEKVKAILKKHLGNKFIHKGENAEKADEAFYEKVAREICDID